MKKRLLCALLVFTLLLSSGVTALAAEPSILWLTDYDTAESFSEGMAIVSKEEKYGFIDRTGKLVVDLKYDYAKSFCEGFAAVSTGGSMDAGGYVEGKWGFIDKTGKVVIPIIYDKVSDFSEGLAAVMKDGKLGFIDTTGKVVVPLTYHGGMYENFYFINGLAVVTKGNFKDPAFVVIDKTGKQPFEFKYDYANLTGYSEGMLVVGVGGEWGFGGAYYLGRSHFDGKYGFIDTKGKEIIAPVYDQVYDFNDGIAVVMKDGKYGAVDKKGNIVVPMIYEDMGIHGSNGRLCVYGENEKWGYVDYTGKVVIDFKYDYCMPFQEGYATNAIDRAWGVIDVSGKTVAPFKNYDLWYYNEGLVIARPDVDSDWGYIDTKGNLFIDPVYEDVTDFSDGVAIVVKDGIVGIISKTPIPYTAKPTASSVLVNGAKVAFDAYSINGNNYFKLRDLAYVLNGTEKQFEVTWDGEKQAINLIPGKSYTAAGSEMANGNKKDATAYLSTATIYINGTKVDLTAYTINGNNYFKLRDLGKAFDFGVIWDGTANTIRIDTSVSYSE